MCVISYNIIGGEGIMCYCNSDSTSDCVTNNTCTGDGCFARKWYTYNATDYGCYNNNNIFNNVVRVECTAGPIESGSYSIKCCDNSDLCNKDLVFPPPSKHNHSYSQTSAKLHTYHSVDKVRELGFSLKWVAGK